MEDLPNSAEWRKQLRHSFICYLLIGIFIGIDYSVIGCTLYLYLRDILKSEVPEMWYGTIISVYFLTSFLLRAVGKRQFQNTHRIKVFVRGALITQAVGYMFYAIPYHPFLLLISRIICSVSEPLDSVIYKEINVTFNHMCRARALSWYSSLKYTGMILGPALTVALFGIDLNDVEMDVTRSNFIGIFMVLLYLLLLFLSLYLVHDCSHDIEHNEDIVVATNPVTDLQCIDGTQKSKSSPQNGAPIAQVDTDQIFDNDVITNHHIELKGHENEPYDSVDSNEKNGTEVDEGIKEKVETKEEDDTKEDLESEMIETIVKDIEDDNDQANLTQDLDSTDEIIEKETEEIKKEGYSEDVEDYNDIQESIIDESKEQNESSEIKEEDEEPQKDHTLATNGIDSSADKRICHKTTNGNHHLDNEQSSSSDEKSVKNTDKKTSIRSDKEFMRQIFNGDTLTRLISSQPVISTKKLFRLVFNNKELFLVFISSFLSTYVLIAFIVFTPVLILGLLKLSIATLSLLLVSSGAFASISCDLIGRYFKTDRFIYIRNLVCMIMQIISCCVLIALRLIPRHTGRDIALVVIYAMTVVLAWCSQRYVLSKFLKSLMPSDLEVPAESLRLAMCRGGMVLGAFSVGFLTPCLHVWSAVLVLFLGLLLFGFIFEMNTFISPRELSLDREMN